MPKVSDVSFLRPVECPRCGAPLPGDALDGELAVCPYCDGTAAKDPRLVFGARFERALARSAGEADLRVCGVTYVLERTLGTGASCDVFAARRARLPSERVVVRIRRGDQPFDREWQLLSQLAEGGAPGADHFRTRLPQLVAHGVRESDGAPVMITRRLSGFDHTAADVRDAFGDTLDPRHGAWMFRRLLELLAWVHASGFSHRAISPEHVLVNGRDHGAMLIGWSRAERSAARSAEDVAQAARTVGVVLGAAATPNLAALLLRYAARGGDAAEAERECVAIARRDFGGSRFVPLHLP